MQQCVQGVQRLFLTRDRIRNRNVTVFEQFLKIAVFLISSYNGIAALSMR